MRYEALQVDLNNNDCDGFSVGVLSKFSQPTPSIKTASMKEKARWIMVTENSLIETEDPTCRVRPLPSSSGAEVKDVKRKLPILVWH